MTPKAKKTTTAARAKTARKAKKPKAEPAEAGSGELVDMNEAIALLKTTRPTFYRWLRAGRIKGMKVGRQWRFYRADVEQFLHGEAPRIGLTADISPLARTLRDRLKEQGLPDVRGHANEVEQVVRQIIVLSYVTRASDIHITSHLQPGETDPEAVLRLRVDGLLHIVATFDARLLAPIMQEWRRLAACDVHETVKPQDGRIMVKVSDLCRSAPAAVLDLRVCFVPAHLGETLTVRLLAPGTVQLKLDNFDYGPADRERIDRALRLPNGIIVCTGPTGSGKTTTLYACVHEVAGPGIKALSVEDPVEYTLPWVTQIPVRAAQGVTFPKALRSLLRSDPDVILLGEVRDLESMQIAIQAALTGHLVLTTLHTDNAAEALIRMLDIGVDAFLAADAVKLIIAQRLVRKVCPHCRKPGKPDADLLHAASEAATSGGLNWQTLDKNFVKPAGCDKCARSGFRGRLPLCETLEVTPSIGRLLRDGADGDQLRDEAVRQGMTTMFADGVRRAAAGETTLREVSRVCRPG